MPTDHNACGCAFAVFAQPDLAQRPVENTSYLVDHRNAVITKTAYRK